MVGAGEGSCVDMVHNRKGVWVTGGFSWFEIVWREFYLGKQRTKRERESRCKFSCPFWWAIAIVTFTVINHCKFEQGSE